MELQFKHQGQTFELREDKDTDLVELYCKETDYCCEVNMLAVSEATFCMPFGPEFIVRRNRDGSFSVATMIYTRLVIEGQVS
jgi:hypothetical protein